MKPQKNEIKNADDFNDTVCDILNDFVNSFSVENGCKKKVSKSDRIEYGFDLHIKWVLTKKGAYLLDRAIERFTKIGLKYFDESEIYIRSSLVFY